MSQHGRIPVPAPATALLLKGAAIAPSTIEAELVTPTGAALLAAVAEGWEPPPAFTLEASGTGAGTRELEEQPNVLRLLIGRTEQASTAPGATRRRVAVLETSVDDENPQFVAAAVTRAFEAGALDVMWSPAVMKKGRPGTVITVIADPSRVEALAQLLLRETTTLGVRVHIEDRFELGRRSVEVDTPFGAVRLKVASLPEGGDRAVPEFESVREAAERTRRPLREVAESAVAAWTASRAGGGSEPDGRKSGSGG
jgi:uncharacterized protein (DUF111 family)